MLTFQALLAALATSWPAAGRRWRAYLSAGNDKALRAKDKVMVFGNKRIKIRTGSGCFNIILFLMDRGKMPRFEFYGQDIRGGEECI